MLRAGEAIVRVPPKMMGVERRGTRSPGKSGPIDAEAVARAALRDPHLPVARREGETRRVKLLVDHREDLVAERTRMQARVRWHLHELMPGLDLAPKALGKFKHLDRVATELENIDGTGAEIARELIVRIRELTVRCDEPQREITRIVRTLAPTLLELPGCGPLTAAKHEIVNDQYEEGPITVTYCPLTGSTVAFRGTSVEGEPLTFGTSGNLVNSNLLMYDRQTDSNWPQILGVAINGPAEGTALEEIPLTWTTWGRWRSLFPDSEVLTTETGHVRSYGSDPYGSYNPLGGYYQPESGPIFPTMWTDPRFPAKEVFIGVKHGPARLAVRKETVRERSVVATSLGGDPVVVLHDPALDEGRAFFGRSGGRRLQLEPGPNPGTYHDARSGSSWDGWGRPLEGGEALRPLVAYDVMWFSWVGFFPATEVVE